MQDKLDVQVRMFATVKKVLKDLNAYHENLTQIMEDSCITGAVDVSKLASLSVLAAWLFGCKYENSMY